MKKYGKGNMDDKVFEDTNDAFGFDNERANQMKKTVVDPIVITKICLAFHKSHPVERWKGN